MQGGPLRLAQSLAFGLLVDLALGLLQREPARQGAAGGVRKEGGKGWGMLMPLLRIPSPTNANPTQGWVRAAGHLPAPALTFCTLLMR